MNKVKVGVIVLVVSLGSYYGYSAYKSKMAFMMQGQGMPAMTVVASYSSLPGFADAVGTLEANEAATLRSEVAGSILSIAFTEGQSVLKNDVLVQIDDSLLQQELLQAKANYGLAEIQLSRRSELRSQGATSAEVKDQAESSLLQSKAQYEQSGIRVKKSKIIAPFNGIVGLRNLSVGDYLKVGDEITKIVNIDTVKIEFSLPEKYFAKLKNGLDVEFSVDAYPNESFVGKLYAVSPFVDQGTRKVTAKAIIDNSQKKLRPGMFARVKVIFEVRDNVIQIPEESLITYNNQNFVMKVIEGKAKLTPVVIGDRYNGNIEIKEGVMPGDTIITAGHSKLQDGAPVTAIPVPPNPNGAQTKAPAATAVAPAASEKGASLDAAPVVKSQQEVAPAKSQTVNPVVVVDVPKTQPLSDKYLLSTPAAGAPAVEPKADAQYPAVKKNEEPMSVEQTVPASAQTPAEETTPVEEALKEINRNNIEPNASAVSNGVNESAPSKEPAVDKSSSAVLPSDAPLLAPVESPVVSPAAAPAVAPVVEESPKAKMPKVKQPKADISTPKKPTSELNIEDIPALGEIKAENYTSANESKPVSTTAPKTDAKSTSKYSNKSKSNNKTQAPADIKSTKDLEPKIQPIPMEEVAPVGSKPVSSLRSKWRFQQRKDEMAMNHLQKVAVLPKMMEKSHVEKIDAKHSQSLDVAKSQPKEAMKALAQVSPVAKPVESFGSEVVASDLGEVSGQGAN